MLDVSPGLHLTRPCAPVEATIQALHPDVIITLDDAAAEMAPVWCRDSRSTVLVELAIDPSVIQLVSWQIGHDEGRLRARIGQAVDTRPLARLVNRLCSGPQPVPSPPCQGHAGRPHGRSASFGPTGRNPARHRGTRHRVAQQSARSVRSHADVLTITTNLPAEAEDDDIVLLDVSVQPDLAIEIVERRRAQDRSTIVDVTVPISATPNGAWSRPVATRLRPASGCARN